MWCIRRDVALKAYEYIETFKDDTAPSDLLALGRVLVTDTSPVPQAWYVYAQAMACMYKCIRNATLLCSRMHNSLHAHILVRRNRRNAGMGDFGDYAQHFGLQIIEHAIRHRWEETTNDVRDIAKHITTITLLPSPAPAPTLLQYYHHHNHHPPT